MKELLIWRGNPSQKLNIGYFISCIFIIPIPFVFWKWLFTKYWIFEITNERIKERTGIFSRKLDETELFRIKDIQLEQPFWIRIFGLSNIKMITSDKTNPILIIPGIENAEELKDELRVAIDVRRTLKGVLERDID